MDHPAINQFESMATSTARILSDNQQQDSKNMPILTKTPMKHYGSNDKHDDHMFKSPGSKVTCVDPFTPSCTGKSLLSELDDAEKDIHVCRSRINDHEDQLLALFRDAEKDIHVCGSRINDHEDQLQYYQSCKNVIEDLIRKDDVELLQLPSSFAVYLGGEQMVAVVCRLNAVIRTPGKYELELKSLASELGTCIRGSDLFICLEDTRVFPGRLVEDDSQKRLSLPNPSFPDGTTPPGFLGFAVNMIDIAAKHLNTKTSAGHGLRETLFFRLFGELQVCETKEDILQAYCCGCAKGGALSLDGGIVRGSGMITLGCKEVDVHFPVIAEKNQLVPFCEPSSLEELEAMVKKKQQQIEDNKYELSLVEEAITYLSQQRSEELHEFHEKKASYLKLLEAKEMSFSQSQRSPIPIDLDSPGL